MAVGVVARRRLPLSRPLSRPSEIDLEPHRVGIGGRVLNGMKRILGMLVLGTVVTIRGVSAVIRQIALEIAQSLAMKVGKVVGWLGVPGRRGPRRKLDVRDEPMARLEI